MVDHLSIDKIPLVSVIMATRNSGNYLRDALNSIQKQTYANLEVIIIDGDSTDQTQKIANEFPQVKFIRQNGKGLFNAWNQGIMSSNGEFVSFLDSDDYWESSALFNHMNLLLTDKNKLGSVGCVHFFLDSENSAPPEFKLSLLDKAHLAYMPGCFVGRRTIFDKIGYFETEWAVASDIIWFGKVKELNDEINLINQVVLNKRVHKNNLSYTSVEEDIYSKELLKLLHQKIRAKKEQ